MLLPNLVLCLFVRIVVICVALPFVLPDMHRVVAPIQSVAPLFLSLLYACLAGVFSRADTSDITRW